MFIYFQISFYTDGQVHAGMFSNLLKHVIEKAKTGRNVTSSISIQIQSNINIGFFGSTAYFRFPFSGKKEFGYPVPVSSCKGTDFF